MKNRWTLLGVILALILITGTKSVMAQTNTPDAVPALSTAQKAAMQRLKTEVEKKAAPVALKMAGVVKRIYENILSDKPDEALRLKLEGELKQVTGELLTIKGQSIRDAVAVLTPEQKQFLKAEMRKQEAPVDLSELIAKLFKLYD